MNEVVCDLTDIDEAGGNFDAFCALCEVVKTAFSARGTRRFEVITILRRYYCLSQELDREVFDRWERHKNPTSRIGSPDELDPVFWFFPLNLRGMAEAVGREIAGRSVGVPRCRAEGDGTSFRRGVRPIISAFRADDRGSTPRPSTSLLQFSVIRLTRKPCIGSSAVSR